MNVKKITLTGMISFYSLCSLAFNLNIRPTENDRLVQDSLAYQKGISIIRALFEGDDAFIQEKTDVHSFFWCTYCEGKIGCCQKFNDTYKTYFTPALKERLNSANFERTMLLLTQNEDEEDSINKSASISKQKITSRQLIFHWSYFEENGDQHDYYFEFIEKQNLLNEWILVRVCQTPGCTNQ